MSAALLPGPAPVALTVNGRAVSAFAEPRTHLADFLRETLDLTGTHLGCEHGICGACTVLLDGEPARACLSFAAACAGADVTTIEGLDGDEVTTELRAAFTREHALQCGYCTPGMLVAARDLVLRLPEADERRVRLGLSGNLCRCTGYVGIVRAVLAVIGERRARGIAAVTAARGLGPVGARAGRSLPSSSWTGLGPAGGSSRSEASDRGGGRGTACSNVGADGGPPTPGPSPPGGGEMRRDGLRLGQTGEAAQRGAADPTPAEFQPAHSFDQIFTVAVLPDAVFALFGRIEDVAACLPGASVTGRPAPDRVLGAIRVRLGPISAAFAGSATISRDEAARSGRILGAGQDGGGRSSTQGVVAYRVLPGPTDGTSRVELTVGYTLRGPLAQFGRPALVRDLAGRIAAEFARNVEAALSGQPVAPAADGLNPVVLLAGLIRDAVRRAAIRLRDRLRGR